MVGNDDTHARYRAHPSSDTSALCACVCVLAFDELSHLPMCIKHLPLGAKGHGPALGPRRLFMAFILFTVSQDRAHAMIGYPYH